MKHWKTILGIFITLTVIGLFLPLIVTQLSFGLDLGTTVSNEIGDAIGGILGPYFSFIGSCLLAYTIYLQIEQRKHDKQKDFEKVIFENSLESLKSAESKIHELNALNTKEKFASTSFINKYFKRNTEAESITVRFLIDEINNALILFNENNISFKSYHLIILYKTEVILELTKASRLGIWNKTIKRVSYFSTHFFEYPNMIQFKQVKTFFVNIKTLKEDFARKFDNNFQTEEIAQLKETCAWLNSFEADFLEYYDLLLGGGWVGVVDERQVKIDAIRDKYELSRKSYWEFLK